jgi:glucose uptake protein GlcU
LLGIAGILALIMIVIGGIVYLTSAGDPERADRGKKTFTYSVIGIIIALSAMVIIRQIAEFFAIQ